MLPTDTQLRGVLRDLPEVHSGRIVVAAQASGSLAPSSPISATATVLVRLFSAIHADLKYGGCDTGACRTVVTSPSQISWKTVVTLGGKTGQVVSQEVGDGGERANTSWSRVSGHSLTLARVLNGWP